MYSLFKWNGFGPLEDFIGVDNYARALSDPVFVSAIGHNFFIVGLSLVVQGPIAIGVALLLNRKLRGRRLFRVIIFIPYVLSEVVVALAWRLILQPNGSFDSLMAAVGLADLRQLWLADTGLVIWTLFAILTWKYVGFGDHPAPRRAPGHPRGARGGRSARRRDLVADAALRHTPTARTDDPDLGVPVDHRVPAAVRPGLGPDRWRSRRRDPDDGDLHGAVRLPTLTARVRQRGRGHPLRHLAGLRARLPALRPPSGSRRRIDPEGRMTTQTEGRMTAMDAGMRRRSIDFSRPLIYVIALVCVGITIVPVLYVVIKGFGTTADLNANPAGWPDLFTTANYAGVLTSSTFWTQVLNSTVAALGTTVGVVALGVMAAFVIARYEFRGRDALYGLFTAGLLFPLTVAVLPLYLLLKNLGLLGSIAGIIIPQVAFQLPVTIIILVPFLRAIPAELEDAAVIDGSSRLGFFLRILLPLSGPGLVTVGVLAFVASWNAYLLPLLTLGRPEAYTLPLGVQYYSTAYSQDTAAVLAFTSLAMLPAVIFFAFAERRIVGGLTGAVKG